MDPVAEDGEDGEDGDASASFTASRSAPPSRSATHQAEQAGEPDQETQRTMRRCGFPKIGGGNDVNTKLLWAHLSKIYTVIWIIEVLDSKYYFQEYLKMN